MLSAQIPELLSTGGPLDRQPVAPLCGRPARTLPDVLFPTVNVDRKRRRSSVTNVRRSGSRPYFEWESELRWLAWRVTYRPGRHCVGRVACSLVLLIVKVEIDSTVVRWLTGRHFVDTNVCSRHFTTTANEMNQVPVRIR